MMRYGNLILGLAGGLAIVLVVLVWAASYFVVVGRLPQATSLIEARVDVPREGAARLGRAGVLQRDVRDAAAQDHIEIKRLAGGGLGVANVAANRRVNLEYEHGEFLADHLILADGDELSLRETTLRVSIQGSNAQLVIAREAKAGAETVRLPDRYPSDRPGFRTWQSSRVTLGGGKTTGQGDDDGLGGPMSQLRHQVQAVVNWFEGAPAWDLRRFMAVSGWPAGAIDIRWQEDRLVARVKSGLLVTRCTRAGRCDVVGRQVWPMMDADLGALTHMTLGRTRYALRIESNAVVFRPVSRHHWVPRADLARTRQDVPNHITVAETDLMRRGLAEPNATAMSAQIAAQWGQQWQALGGGVLSVLLAITGAIWIALGAVFLGVHRHEDPFVLYKALAAVAVAFFTAHLPLHALPIIGGGFASIGVAARFLAFATLFSAMVVKRNGIYHVVGAVLCVFAWLTQGDITAISNITQRMGVGIQGGVIAVAGVFVVMPIVLWAQSARPMLYVFWMAVSGLVGIGIVNGAYLALGHPMTVYVRLLETHISVAGVIGAASVLAMIAPVARAQNALGALFLGRGLWGIPNRVLVLLLMGLTVVLAGVTLVGTETGTGGVQPTEATKSVIVLSFSLYLVTMAQMTRLSSASGNNIVAFTVLGLCFGALMFASFANFDMSPVLLVFLTLSLLVFLTLSLSISFTLIQRFPVLGTMAVGGILAVMVLGVLDNFPLVVVLVTIGGAVYMSARRTTLQMPMWDAAMLRHRGGQWEMPGVIQWSKRRRRRSGNVFWRRLMARQGAGWLVMVAVCAIMVVLALGVGVREVHAMMDKERLERFETALPTTPTERVISWYDSSLFRTDDEGRVIVRYPDFSLQVRKSREVIAASGCGMGTLIEKALLAVQLNALLSLDRGASRVKRALRQSCIAQNSAHAFPPTGAPSTAMLAVPAVQDDFIATFMISALGLDAIVVLGVFQMIFVFSMLTMAFWARYRHSNDPRLRGHYMLASYVMAGFALMIGLQFAFSWANILGLLPVVGQPMTFLSFGGSHHMFLALPAVVAVMVFGRMTGGKRDVDQEARDLAVPFGKFSPFRDDGF